MSAWAYLSLAIVFEVIGTSSLKMSDGFTQTWPSVICIACFMVALYMLSQSVKTLEISIVYAIWSGVGIALIAIIGVFIFDETITLRKFLFMSLIVIGVVGLQIDSDGQTSATNPAQ